MHDHGLPEVVALSYWGYAFSDVTRNCVYALNNSFVWLTPIDVRWTRTMS